MKIGSSGSLEYWVQCRSWISGSRNLLFEDSLSCVHFDLVGTSIEKFFEVAREKKNPCRQFGEKVLGIH